MKWTVGIDKLGIVLYMLLCIFSVANIHSVDPTLGQKQLVFLGISVFVGILIFLSGKNFFEYMSPVIYVIGIIMLIGLFPFGKEIMGQKNWYKFGGFSMQPVEFAKIGTALLLAKYASSYNYNIRNIRHLCNSFAIIAIPAAIVLAIPDVGSMLIFSAFFIVLYREGMSSFMFTLAVILFTIFFASLVYNPIYIVSTILIVAVLFVILSSSRIRWNFGAIFMLLLTTSSVCFLSIKSQEILKKLPKHQRERIEVLYKGEANFRDTSGYNLLYSKTAIGSGGLWGKGYREGSVTQGKFVPEQKTDYIFCTVGEEWGFAGAAALILCYTLFIGRIYYLAEKQKNKFNRIFGYSFGSIIFLHFCINIGMVLGLFPTVGIPLPFFSYGGSSLLAFSTMTFIFFKLNSEDRMSLV